MSESVEQAAPRFTFEEQVLSALQSIDKLFEADKQIDALHRQSIDLLTEWVKALQEDHGELRESLFALSNRIEAMTRLLEVHGKALGTLVVPS